MKTATATATMTIRDAVLSHPDPIVMIGSNRTYQWWMVAYRVHPGKSLAMLCPVLYAPDHVYPGEQWVHINQKPLYEDMDTIITLIQD
jgi:hypothetical protein